MRTDIQRLWELAGGSSPKGWNIVTLESLLESPKSISVGVMYPGGHAENGVPLVKVSDVKSGQIAQEPDYRISDSVDKEYGRTKLKGNEFLITLVGNPGDCVVVDSGMIGWNVARALAVLKLKDSELRSWLKLILMSPASKHIIDSRLNTTVQKTLNLKDIKELPIPIPSKDLMKSVCLISASYEQKIKLNKKTNQTLEQMAQALFKSWFVDFDPVIDNALAAGNPIPEALQLRAELRKKAIAERSTNPKLKPLPEDIQQLFPSEFEHCGDVSAGIFGFIPKGWKNGTLESVAKYSTSRIDCGKLTEENYISTENMLAYKKGITKASSLPKVNTTPSFLPGQILISNIRPYFQKIWLASFQGGRSNDVLGFETLVGNTETYLMCLLSQDSFFEYMMATSKGSKMPRGDKKAIMEWPISVPPTNLVASFSTFTKDLYKRRTARDKENESLIKLRDTLLPKLISGEITI